MKKTIQQEFEELQRLWNEFIDELAKALRADKFISWLDWYFKSGRNPKLVYWIFVWVVVSLIVGLVILSELFRTL